jgi:hypothetical protein
MMDTSSDDDTPLVALPNGKGSNGRQNGKADSRNANGKRLLDPSSDLSEDDRPLVSLLSLIYFMDNDSDLLDRLKESRAPRARRLLAALRLQHLKIAKTATMMLHWL